MECFITNKGKGIPITVVEQKDFSAWLKKQNPQLKKWLTTTNFVPENGAARLIANAKGELSQVIYCLSNLKNFWNFGQLSFSLPEGIYSLQAQTQSHENLALAWGMGAYQFAKYKKPLRKPAKLILSNACNSASLISKLTAIYYVRDLINTPTDDMGPTELAQSVSELCQKFKAKFTQIKGLDLLKKNYASIYTVGRASDDAPRLLDFKWGNSKHPLVTLVGKGVCFDSGGLDLKPSAYMLLMKKDMGGAAHVLGLARMIMQAKLPIRLRVLIPAVENVISGNAYRPGDVIKSRKGLTIEIGNTDAEGRVILADALTEAATENPDLIIDMATLTGAARVALGTDLPVMFSNQDSVANDLVRHGELQSDLMWRLPLYSPYRDSLNSNIADINNDSSDSYGGAITAALFLKEFVPDHIPWVHFDMMAWNLKSRPSRPQGGEAMALRAIFSYLSARYSNSK